MGGRNSHQSSSRLNAADSSEFTLEKTDGKTFVSGCMILARMMQCVGEDFESLDEEDQARILAFSLDQSSLAHNEIPQEELGIHHDVFFNSALQIAWTISQRLKETLSVIEAKEDRMDPVLYQELRDDFRNMVLSTLGPEDARAIKEAMLYKELTDFFRTRAQVSPITQLPNSYYGRLQLVNMVKNKEKINVAFGDLNGLGGLNEALGEALVDKLLYKVGQYMNTSVREEDQVLHGEFASGDEWGAPSVEHNVTHEHGDEFTIYFNIPFNLNGGYSHFERLLCAAYNVTQRIRDLDVSLELTQFDYDQILKKFEDLSLKKDAGAALTDKEKDGLAFLERVMAENLLATYTTNRRGGTEDITLYRLTVPGLGMKMGCVSIDSAQHEGLTPDDVVARTQAAEAEAKMLKNNKDVVWFYDEQGNKISTHDDKKEVPVHPDWFKNNAYVVGLDKGQYILFDGTQSYFIKGTRLHVSLIPHKVISK